MHIGMAVDASGFSIGKYKGGMTRPAVRFPVAPGEGQGRGVVIECVGCRIQFPAAGVVAYIATYFELVSMRGICVESYQQERENRKYDQ
jgi:benzoyl-CoA reductase/2-hydroxyglutaryl-CoA dehydratase subunit BcrC/BadD/HgdB